MPKKGSRATNRKKIGPFGHGQWNKTYNHRHAMRVLEHEPEKARAILALKEKPVPLTEISRRFNVPEPVIREIFRHYGGRSTSVVNQIRGQATRGKKLKKHDLAAKETKTRLGIAYKKRLLEYRKMPSQRLVRALKSFEGEVKELKEKMKTARFNHDRKAYYSHRDKANRRQIRINALKAILRERGLLE